MRFVLAKAIALLLSGLILYISLKKNNPMIGILGFGLLLLVIWVKKKDFTFLNNEI